MAITQKQRAEAEACVRSLLGTVKNPDGLLFALIISAEAELSEEPASDQRRQQLAALVAAVRDAMAARAGGSAFESEAPLLRATG